MGKFFKNYWYITGKGQQLGANAMKCFIRTKDAPCHVFLASNSLMNCFGAVTVRRRNKKIV